MFHLIQNFIISNITNIKIINIYNTFCTNSLKSSMDFILIAQLSHMWLVATPWHSEVLDITKLFAQVLVLMYDSFNYCTSLPMVGIIKYFQCFAI